MVERWAFRPPLLDVNQRASVDRLQTHLRRGQSGRGGGGNGEGDGEGAAPRFSVWQLGADTQEDGRPYDMLCEYFIEKQRVGLLENASTAIYMVPPLPKYTQPLGVGSAKEKRRKGRIGRCYCATAAVRAKRANVLWAVCVQLPDPNFMYAYVIAK